MGTHPMNLAQSSKMEKMNTAKGRSHSILYILSELSAIMVGFGIEV